MNAVPTRSSTLPRFPSPRRIGWKVFYGALASRFQIPEWTFMNYGLDDDGPDPALGCVDEIHRPFVRLYAHVVEPASPLDAADLVEVGSGRGGGARWLATCSGARSVQGFDLAPQAVALARRLHAGVPGLSFDVAAAHCLPRASESADVVLNVESCHHYPSLSAFFDEAWRVLRPGGWFCTASYFRSAGADRFRSAIHRASFQVNRLDDISPGVVRALRATEGLKRDLIARHAPRIWRRLLRHFAGVEGSALHRGLVDGTIVYLSAALHKRAGS